MTDVLIKRELLEELRDAANDCLNHAIMRGNDRNIPTYTELVEQADAALDAPRQPEGEGLEVRATEEHHRTQGGIEYYDLCRLSDAQRAIAELREECKIHRNSAAGAHNQLRANRLETERLAVDWLAAVAERDTLRQQLAEQDAEIERLRVQLLAIFSAEPGRHNIEWAKAMAATGNNEAYAKWREAFDQRDKLAGLLREVRVVVAREVERWTRAAAILPVNANVASGLLTRIDAALAEVEPCQESPAPTT